MNVFTNRQVNQASTKKRDQEYQKSLQKTVEATFGNSIAGCLVSGIDRSLTAMDPHYPVEPISGFVAICRCPQCGWIDSHYIEYVTKNYITRKCSSDNCDRKWKQER